MEHREQKLQCTVRAERRLTHLFPQSREVGRGPRDRPETCPGGGTRPDRGPRHPPGGSARHA
eukprot:8677609-Alexandrium_andersonii.AAC.1